MTQLNNLLSKPQALIVRLAVGGVFGLAIAALTQALPDYGDTAKPAIWMQVAISALTLGAFVLWAGAGAMRRVSLAVWGVVALSLIGFIAWHQASHFSEARYSPFFFNAFFLIYPFLFITHELISSADQAGKPIAPYGLYFDEAWKRGVQLALALLFTALFWAILWLGAILLGFIGFDWFKDLLENDYFAWAVTGLALGSSVHLGDVQTKLLGNVRALILGVLSWLLPVITLIGLIFSVSLLFSGLEPLWKTKAATATLLSASVALVLLINAAYQQGDEERPVHIIMKWAARLACGLLLVFAGLGVMSLGLRVGQYGWTPERVLAAIGVGFALAYGIGYGVAAVLRGRWLAAIEPINIGLAIAKSVVFLVVLTPLADPARLSVESQVARLTSGKVTAEAFDWRFLRYESGDYGTNALTSLSQSGPTVAIKAAALKAKAYKDDQRWDMPAPKSEPDPTAKPDAKRYVMVSPAGNTLPPSYLDQAFEVNGDGLCLIDDKGKEPCYAALIDLNDDIKPEVVVFSSHIIKIFTEGEKGWTVAGHIYSPSDQMRADFKAGKIAVTKAEWNDLKIGDAVRSVDK